MTNVSTAGPLALPDLRGKVVLVTGASTGIGAAAAKVLQACGHIDILVNNAGRLVQRVMIADFTDELFDEVMHINARSMLAGQNVEVNGGQYMP